MPSITKVTKPWGEEIILTPPDLPYAGKILKINANHRLSLQYHDQKTETLTLIQGNALLYLGNSPENLQEIKMTTQESYTITPHTLHRLKALTDTTILEVSTPPIGTTFRLQDDYHRPNETLKG